MAPITGVTTEQERVSALFCIWRLSNHKLDLILRRLTKEGVMKKNLGHVF
jgi:hypothetical protein